MGVIWGVRLYRKIGLLYSFFFMCDWVFLGFKWFFLGYVGSD